MDLSEIKYGGHEGNRSDTFPVTLPAFQAMFGTEEKCRAYLFTARWPGGFVCPKCSSTHAWMTDTRGEMLCENGHRTSATAGTVMHRTKQPLTSWFHGAWLMVTMTPGISAVQFQRQMGIPRYETAFQMLHKLRSATVAPDRDPLCCTVEVDEFYVGGPEPGRPGRGVEKKATVVIGVERKTWKDKDGVEHTRAGRVRAAVVPDTKGETLIPWVKTHVAPGAQVDTDGHGGYNGLKAEGYNHVPVVEAELKHLHRVVSNIKTWIAGTHHGAVRNKHLQAYLNEYTFRFNRRKNPWAAFNRLLGLAVDADTRPEYHTLYCAGKPGCWQHLQGGDSGMAPESMQAAFARGVKGRKP